MRGGKLFSVGFDWIYHGAISVPVLYHLHDSHSIIAQGVAHEKREDEKIVKRRKYIFVTLPRCSYRR